MRRIVIKIVPDTTLGEILERVGMVSVGASFQHDFSEQWIHLHFVTMKLQLVSEDVTPIYRTHIEGSVLGLHIQQDVGRIDRLENTGWHCDVLLHSHSRLQLS